MPGLDAFGAGARMRELVPALQKLFKGDYAHQGEFWSWPSTTPVPRPDPAAQSADVARRARSELA